MTTAQLIRAALYGGRRMTVAELAAAVGQKRQLVYKALHAHPDFAIVGEMPSVEGRRGGNRVAAIWAMASTGPAVKRGSSMLGPSGLGRGEIRDTEGTPTDNHDYGGGIVAITFVASEEQADCPKLGRVVLAACIDGYVTDSARQRGPCDSCAIGRARRAAWAGADFEDELEADDSDSLDLR